VRGPFSQILTTKSTKKNKKAQKQFKKFLKRESEGGTTFKMFLPHGRGDMTGSQFGRRRVSRRFSISWEAARLASLFKQSVAARGPFSQILTTKSTKKNKKGLKSF